MNTNKKSYTVKINNLNFLKMPFVTDADREIQISEEEYIKVQTCKFTEIGQGNEELKTFEAVSNPYADALRVAREGNCFQIVNRSPLGIMSLPAEKQEELKEGYQAGLDVTETLEVPKKPEGL